MNPEFQAYVEAIAEDINEHQPTRVADQSDVYTHPPGHCEPPMLGTMNKNRAGVAARRSSHGEPIAYHGLL